MTDEGEPSCETNKVTILPPHRSLPNQDIKHLTSEVFSVAEQLLRIELELCAQLQSLNFSSPVEYVYSPIEYAFNLHAQFVRKFCNSFKKVLFLGMNPGPWGMSQTGVRVPNAFP